VGDEEAKPFFPYGSSRRKQLHLSDMPATGTFAFSPVFSTPSEADLIGWLSAYGGADPRDLRVGSARPGMLEIHDIIPELAT